MRLGAQTNAGSAGEPEPAAFRLFGRDLQPLASPDPFDPLVIDHPAGRRTQEFSDLTVAVAPVPVNEFDDIGGQPLFVVSPARDLALGRTVLSEYAANPASRSFRRRTWSDFSPPNSRRQR